MSDDTDTRNDSESVEKKKKPKNTAAIIGGIIFTLFVLIAACCFGVYLVTTVIDTVNAGRGN